MAAIAAGSIDIDKPGKYPIVLSDALLGKTSKEVYTGVRYNHKPDPSSDSSSMHLEPSDSHGYDLSFTDNADKYSYHGARTTGDGQYVLIFDPAKKHFVLHRIDSTFDMNLVSAPWADASTLRSQYPQLDTPQSKTPAAAAPPQRKAAKPTKKPVPAAKAETQRKKVEKAKKPKPPPAREPSPQAEEEEDSDDGFTIEYPDGPSSQTFQFNATPIFKHDATSDEDSDADAEGEEDIEERNQDVDHLKLPSPAGNNAGGMSDEEMELDLEAELEQALKETEGAAVDEDSESEEE